MWREREPLSCLGEIIAQEGTPLAYGLGADTRRGECSLLPIVICTHHQIPHRMAARPHWAMKAGVRVNSATWE